jgi:hypothetical protein
MSRHNLDDKKEKVNLKNEFILKIHPSLAKVLNEMWIEIENQFQTNAYSFFEIFKNLKFKI